MFTKNCKYIGVLVNNISIILFLLLSCDNVLGQIYTPNGSYVNVFEIGEQLSNAEKEALKYEFTTKYPRAVYWGEATTTYNCHAYAWSVAEGGRKYWMNDPNDDIYMNDGSYTQTDRADPKAEKVSYSKDDHSAIIPFPNSVYFISKWGSACLMKHSYRDCPYNPNELKYYKLSMEILGDDIVSLPDGYSMVEKTYTLSNVPKGAIVEWIVDRGEIIEGQGSNTIKVQIKAGITFIDAKVHCNTGLVVKIPFNLSVKASSAPIVTDIEMFKYGQLDGEFTLKAISNHPEGVFEWFVSDSNAELYEIPYPGDATFLEYPNIFKAIRFYKQGTYTITVISRMQGSNYDYVYSKDFDITEVASRHP